MNFIKLENVSKVFRDKNRTSALSNINLNFGSGKIYCLLGPSGSGKTTLLRILAGIENPTSGKVFIGGSNQTNIDAQKRNIGFVFQDVNSIFPHLNVFDNVAFPLKLGLRKDLFKNSTVYEVNRLLGFVNLLDKAKKYPNQLSGGEKQRVSIARSLIYNPKILLLDEPLSSLDNILKGEMLQLIKRIRDEFSTTIFYVTHDEREALELADEVIILSDGQVLQKDTVKDITLNPVNSKVAKILGGWNVLNCQHFEEENLSYVNILDKKIEIQKGKLNQTEIEIGLPIALLEITENEELADGYIFLDVVVEKVIPFKGKEIVYFKSNFDNLTILKSELQGRQLNLNRKFFLKILKDEIKIWQ